MRLHRAEDKGHTGKQLHYYTPLFSGFRLDSYSWIDVSTVLYLFCVCSLSQVKRLQYVLSIHWPISRHPPGSEDSQCSLSSHMSVVSPTVVSPCASALQRWLQTEACTTEKKCGSALLLCPSSNRLWAIKHFSTWHLPKPSSTFLPNVKNTHTRKLNPKYQTILLFLLFQLATQSETRMHIFVSVYLLETVDYLLNVGPKY